MNTRKKSAQELLKPLPSTQAHLTSAHFRQLAFVDYVAARLLLLNEMPLQGLILASTCVEKYLKAVLATRGKMTKTHLDSQDFFGIFRSEGLGVDEYVNENFVRYLGRSYELRYIEATTGPLSIAVETRKLLAELDYTVSQFNQRIRMFRGGELQEVDYHVAVRTKDENVWRENYLLNDIDKGKFVTTPGLLWCAIVRPMDTMLELQHKFYRARDNGNFDFPIARFDRPATLSLEFRDILDREYAFGAAPSDAATNSYT
jgi:hypothetical protein